MRKPKVIVKTTTNKRKAAALIKQGYVMQGGASVSLVGIFGGRTKTYTLVKTEQR